MLVAVVCAVLALSVGGYLYVKRHTLSQKVRVALLGSLVALSIGGAWASNAEKDKTEATWMADAIVWPKDKMPLKVWFDLANYPEYEEAFTGAVKTWNDRVEFEVFRITQDRAEADVVFKTTDGSACGDDGGLDRKAAMSACLTGKQVIVQIRKIDSVGLAFRQTLHELGHALGLDHDETGAMSEAAMEPQAGDYPELLLISNKDTSAVQGRFRR
jgi:hypothetical protein